MYSFWLVLILLLALINVEYCDIQFVILHTNDMHGRFEETERNSGTCKKNNGSKACVGGFARLAHEVRGIRNDTAGSRKEVLFLNAGDTYTGTSWFTLFKSNITTEFINALQFDVLVSSFII